VEIDGENPLSRIVAGDGPMFPNIGNQHGDDTTDRLYLPVINRRGERKFQRESFTTKGTKNTKLGRFRARSAPATSFVTFVSSWFESFSPPPTSARIVLSSLISAPAPTE
jgi:hypothetical protein